MGFMTIKPSFGRMFLELFPNNQQANPSSNHHGSVENDVVFFKGNDPIADVYPIFVCLLSLNW